MIKLQTLAFPGTELPGPREMYFTFCQQCVPLLSWSSILIPKYGSLAADGFFNGFSIEKWRTTCRIDDLGLGLSGTGRVILQIGINALGRGTRWILEVEIALSNTPAEIDIARFSTLENGILIFNIVALEDATLAAGYYFTKTKPLNDVRLGIVVTHFNRKNYVLPAIRRVTVQLLQDPEIEGRVDLIVVDNSSNITPEEAGGATLIHNRNLGGSGGFMRGLLYLKDHGYSHCLFMDDDATSEIESIRRTLRIMQFAKSPRLAVAGSMLLDDEPTKLHEAGAGFSNGTGWQMKHGLLMDDPEDVLRAEVNDRSIDYGAWWHFAFQIDQVRNFSFPFFVRGDDILFSLSNDFEIMTMNGISVWAEDFSVKENPITIYLDARARLVLYILLSENKPARLYRVFRRSIRNFLYSYKYSHARAITLAMQHMMRGPDFWTNNLDLAAIRQEFSKICPGETLEPFDLPSDTETRHPCAEHWWDRLTRKLTLNGFLLPGGLIRHKTVVVQKGYTGAAQSIFRYLRVIYIDRNGQRGFVVEHDKRRFWEEYFLARKTRRELSKCFDELRDAYLNALTYLTSETFWRSVYSEGNSGTESIEFHQYPSPPPALKTTSATENL